MVVTVPHRTLSRQIRGTMTLRLSHMPVISQHPSHPKLERSQAHITASRQKHVGS